MHGAIALLLDISFLLKNEIALIIDQNRFFVNEMQFLHEILKFPLCISQNFCVKIRSCIATSKPKKNETTSMKPHFNSEQIMKLIANSMVRYKNKWAAAGMVLVHWSRKHWCFFLYHPAVKVAVSDEKIETEETMAASTAAASTEAETQSA